MSRQPGNSTGSQPLPSLPSASPLLVLTDCFVHDFEIGKTFHRTNIVGDGNCSFRSLVAAFYGDYSLAKANRLRLEMYEYVVEISQGKHREFFNPEAPTDTEFLTMLLSAEPEGNHRTVRSGVYSRAPQFDPDSHLNNLQNPAFVNFIFQYYLSWLRRPGVWASADVLTLFREKFKCSIILYEYHEKPGGKEEFSKISYFILEKADKEIHLLRLNDIHYEALLDEKQYQDAPQNVRKSATSSSSSHHQTFSKLIHKAAPAIPIAKASIAKDSRVNEFPSPASAARPQQSSPLPKKNIPAQLVSSPAAVPSSARNKPPPQKSRPAPASIPLTAPKSSVQKPFNGANGAKFYDFPIKGSYYKRVTIQQPPYQAPPRENAKVRSSAHNKPLPQKPRAPATALTAPSSSVENPINQRSARSYLHAFQGNSSDILNTLVPHYEKTPAGESAEKTDQQRRPRPLPTGQASINSSVPPTSTAAVLVVSPSQGPSNSNKNNNPPPPSQGPEAAAAAVDEPMVDEASLKAAKDAAAAKRETRKRKKKERKQRKNEEKKAKRAANVVAATPCDFQADRVAFFNVLQQERKSFQDGCKELAMHFQEQANLSDPILSQVAQKNLQMTTLLPFLWNLVSCFKFFRQKNVESLWGDVSGQSFNLEILSGLLNEQMALSVEEKDFPQAYGNGPDRLMAYHRAMMRNRKPNERPALVYLSILQCTYAEADRNPSGSPTLQAIQLLKDLLQRIGEEIHSKEQEIIIVIIELFFFWIFPTSDHHPFIYILWIPGYFRDIILFLLQISIEAFLGSVRLAGPQRVQLVGTFLFSHCLGTNRDEILGLEAFRPLAEKPFFIENHPNREFRAIGQIAKSAAAAEEKNKKKKNSPTTTAANNSVNDAIGDEPMIIEDSLNLPVEIHDGPEEEKLSSSSSSPPKKTKNAADLYGKDNFPPGLRAWNSLTDLSYRTACVSFGAQPLQCQQALRSILPPILNETIEFINLHFNRWREISFSIHKGRHSLSFSSWLRDNGYFCRCFNIEMESSTVTRMMALSTALKKEAGNGNSSVAPRSPLPPPLSSALVKRATINVLVDLIWEINELVLMVLQKLFYKNYNKPEFLQLFYQEKSLLIHHIYRECYIIESRSARMKKERLAKNNPTNKEGMETENTNSPLANEDIQSNNQQSTEELKTIDGQEFIDSAREIRDDLLNINPSYKLPNGYGLSHILADAASRIIVSCRMILFVDNGKVFFDRLERVVRYDFLDFFHEWDEFPRIFLSSFQKNGDSPKSTESSPRMEFSSPYDLAKYLSQKIIERFRTGKTPSNLTFNQCKELENRFYSIQMDYLSFLSEKLQTESLEELFKTGYNGERASELSDVMKLYVVIQKKVEQLANDKKENFQALQTQKNSHIPTENPEAKIRFKVENSLISLHWKSFSLIPQLQLNNSPSILLSKLGIKEVSRVALNNEEIKSRIIKRLNLTDHSNIPSIDIFEDLRPPGSKISLDNFYSNPQNNYLVYSHFFPGLMARVGTSDWDKLSVMTNGEQLAAIIGKIDETKFFTLSQEFLSSVPDEEWPSRDRDYDYRPPAYGQLSLSRMKRRGLTFIAIDPGVLNVMTAALINEDIIEEAQVLEALHRANILKEMEKPPNNGQEEKPPDKEKKKSRNRAARKRAREKYSVRTRQFSSAEFYELLGYTINRAISARWKRQAERDHPALKDIASGALIRHTADEEKYQRFCQWAMETFLIRRKEYSQRKYRQQKLQAYRRRQSGLVQLLNRLCSFDGVNRNPKDCVLLWGDGSWGDIRGHQKVPNRGLFDGLRKFFYAAFLVNEFRTTMLTSCCHVRGEYGRLNKDGTTAKRNPPPGEETTKDLRTVHCPSCGKIFNRDCNAAINILVNFFYFAETGVRLEEFKRGSEIKTGRKRKADDDDDDEVLLASWAALLYKRSKAARQHVEASEAVEAELS